MSLMGSKTPVAAASFGAGAHDASELEALRRYLPTGLRDRLCRGNNGDWSGDGIALIADISGYSRTASWLQERDRVGGAEQLSSCVNDYISEMVAIIESFGGDILHFAGDALICIWRLPEPDASVASVACALALVETLDAVEVLPGVSFSLHVALDCGRAAEWRVGESSLNIFAHCLIFEHWRRLSAALDAASRGEVALSVDAIALLPTEIAAALTLKPVGEGISIVTPKDEEAFDALLERFRNTSPLGTPPNPAALALALNRASLSASKRGDSGGSSSSSSSSSWPLDRAVHARAILGHVPPNVLLTLRQTRSLWIASTRQVSCVFICFPQCAASGFEQKSQLDAAFRRCVGIISSCGGTLRQFLVDDKGTVLIAVFGAPPRATVDDASRALVAAVEMHSSIVSVYPDAADGVAAGVCSGRAFCGNLGSRSRCEFTVIGDCVNMAARLMGQAKKLHRSVLCDAATREAHLILASSRRSSAFAPHVTVDDLALEVTAKGKNAPIETFGVSSNARRESMESPQPTKSSRRRRVLHKKASFDVRNTSPRSRSTNPLRASLPTLFGREAELLAIAAALSPSADGCASANSRTSASETTAATKIGSTALNANALSTPQRGTLVSVESSLGMGKTLFGRSVLLSILGIHRASPGEASAKLRWPSVYAESIAGSAESSTTPWLAWRASIRAALSVIRLVDAFPGGEREQADGLQLLRDVVPGLSLGSFAAGTTTLGVGNSSGGGSGGTPPRGRRRRRRKSRWLSGNSNSRPSTPSGSPQKSQSRRTSRFESSGSCSSSGSRPLSVRLPGTEGSAADGMGVSTLSGQTRIDCVVTACLAVLRARAGAEPRRIILIDDPHLLDRCSLALAVAVRERLRWTTLIMVPSEAHMWGSNESIRQLREAVVASVPLILPPLSLDDSFTLVLAGLDFTLSDATDRTQLLDAFAPVLNAAQGNPRLLSAIVATCKRKRLAVVDATGRLTSIDRSGLAALAERASDLHATSVQVSIDACTRPAANVLAVASTLGDPFPRSLLRGVSIEVLAARNRERARLGSSPSSGVLPSGWVNAAIDELIETVELLETTTHDDTLLRFKHAHVACAVYSGFGAESKRNAHVEALATYEREINVLPTARDDEGVWGEILRLAVYTPREVERRVAGLLPTLVRHAKGAAPAATSGPGSSSAPRATVGPALRLALYGSIYASSMFDCCMLDECIEMLEVVRAVLERGEGVDPPPVALLLLRTRQLLGEALCVHDRSADAVPHLERCLADAGEGIASDVSTLMRRLSQEKALQQLRDASATHHPLLREDDGEDGEGWESSTVYCSDEARGGGDDVAVLPSVVALQRLLACRVMERLAKVYFQSGRPLDALYCCWRGVNLTLELCGDGDGDCVSSADDDAVLSPSTTIGLTPELARAYVVLCFVTKNASLGVLAERISSRRDLPRFGPQAQIYCSMVSGGMQIGEANFECAETALIASAVAAEAVGDNAGYASAMSVLSWSRYVAGDFASSLEASRTLLAFGESASMSHIVEWGRLGVVRSLVELVPAAASSLDEQAALVEELRAHLDEVERIQASYTASGLLSDRVYATGLLLSMLKLLGQSDRAQGMAKEEGLPLVAVCGTQLVEISGYFSVLATLIDCVEYLPGFEFDDGPSPLRASIDVALTLFEQEYSAKFIVAAPRAFTLRARLLRVEADETSDAELAATMRRSAAAKLDDALALAAHFGMEHEARAARAERVQLLGEGSAATPQIPQDAQTSRAAALISALRPEKSDVSVQDVDSALTEASDSGGDDCAAFLARCVGEIDSLRALGVEGWVASVPLVCSVWRLLRAGGGAPSEEEAVGGGGDAGGLADAGEGPASALIRRTVRTVRGADGDEWTAERKRAVRDVAAALLMIVLQMPRRA